MTDEEWERIWREIEAAEAARIATEIEAAWRWWEQVNAQTEDHPIAIEARAVVSQVRGQDGSTAAQI